MFIKSINVCLRLTHAVSKTSRQNWICYDIKMSLLNGEMSETLLDEWMNKLDIKLDDTSIIHWFRKTS